jgi:hypothetical protein
MPDIDIDYGRVNTNEFYSMAILCSETLGGRCGYPEDAGGIELSEGAREAPCERGLSRKRRRFKPPTRAGGFRFRLSSAHAWRRSRSVRPSQRLRGPDGSQQLGGFATAPLRDSFGREPGGSSSARWPRGAGTPSVGASRLTTVSFATNPPARIHSRHLERKDGHRPCPKAFERRTSRSLLMAGCAVANSRTS